MVVCRGPAICFICMASIEMGERWLSLSGSWGAIVWQLRARKGAEIGGGDTVRGAGCFVQCS